MRRSRDGSAGTRARWSSARHAYPIGTVQTAAAMADTNSLPAQWLATHVALRLVLERRLGAGWRGVPLERRPNAQAASWRALRRVQPVARSRHGADRVDARRRHWRRSGAHARPCTCARRGGKRSRRRAQRSTPAGRCPTNARRALPAGLGAARSLRQGGRLRIGRLLTRLGIVGGRDIAPTALQEEVDAARAEANASAVNDLDLGAGLFAAVALAPGQPVPRLRWLPTRIDGLEELLDG